MKLSHTILLILLTATFLMPESHPFEKLAIKSYSIDSAWPSSLRSVKGKATITVDNTGDWRSVSAINATVYRNSSTFANGTCSNVTFVKGTGSYTLTGLVTLAEGVTIWQAIGAALSFRPSEYTVDVYATMLHGDGSTEQIEKKAIPVTKFLK